MDDIGRTLSWGALKSFLCGLGPESALMRDLHPEAAEWATTLKTNIILADIFDCLAQINSNLIGIGSGKRAKAPKPYPRPKQNKTVHKLGSGALPADKLREWIEERRAKNG